MSEKSFLKTKFREYYIKNRIPLLPKIEQREFGVGDFKKKITNRHLHFPNISALKDYLVMTTPLHISASVAYYGNVKGRIWVDGPFCPKCKYELDRHGNVWNCIKCDINYIIESKISKFTKDKIIKIFESSLRK